MTTIESLCNNALDEIGYKHHISSVWDGSMAARIALDIFGQTRDELLHKLAPDWSRADAQLVVLKQAPADQYQTNPWNSAFPPLPWLFEYAFPADCVNPLQIKPKLYVLPVWRPRYIPYRLNNDATTGENSILCNEPDAICSYTKQVLDPDIWHEDFTIILIKVLAQKFSASLGGRPPQPQQERGNANAA